MRAKIKFNNGIGALLCETCDIIITTGFGHDKDKEHYCDKHKSKVAEVEIVPGS